MTLADILVAVKNLCSVSGTGQDVFLTQSINDGQADFTREINMPYTETRGSLSIVSYQQAYTTATNVDTISSVVYKNKHILSPVNFNQWVVLSQMSSNSNPRYWIMHENKLKIYPNPTATTTTTLNGGITDSATNIVLTSVAGLEQKGRALIGTEVISWEYIDTLTLKGCSRGVEGTTAASHLTGATFTYRELEYGYYKNLADLTGTDTSEIPTRYHEAMVMYASARWFMKNENRLMHDDLMTRYAVIKQQALADLGQKQAQSFTSTLTDTIPLRTYDNTYPENGSLS